MARAKVRRSGLRGGAPTRPPAPARPLTVVIDTSVLVDHLRGDDRAHALVTQAHVAGERVAASVLSKIEVLAGVRPGEEKTTRQLLDQIDWIEVDDGLAEQAGALAALFARSHPGVDVADYVIAATVERLDAELWTRNRKHFPMFAGLMDPYDL